MPPAGHSLGPTLLVLDGAAIDFGGEPNASVSLLESGALFVYGSATDPSPLMCGRPLSTLGYVALEFGG